MRIGLLGFGYVGSQVFQRLQSGAEPGLEVAFVHNRSADKLAGVPRELVLEDLGGMAARRPDLVIEMAHPRYTREWGEAILGFAHYLPLSVTALADAPLHDRLVAQAKRSGRRIFVPHGALPGLDSLVEWRHQWREVTITFIKNPASIDFSESGYDVSQIHGETVVYDGPARGIAKLYPRNVNTMVTCGLATVGLDACRARLIADPEIQVGVADVVALGRDGSRLHLRKEQPMVGVSGSELFESQYGSLLRAAGLPARAGEALAFV